MIFAARICVVSCSPPAPHKKPVPPRSERGHDKRKRRKIEYGREDGRPQKEAKTGEQKIGFAVACEIVSVPVESGRRGRLHAKMRDLSPKGGAGLQLSAD